MALHEVGEIDANGVVELSDGSYGFPVWTLMPNVGMFVTYVPVDIPDLAIQSWLADERTSDL